MSRLTNWPAISARSHRAMARPSTARQWASTQAGGLASTSCSQAPWRVKSGVDLGEIGRQLLDAGAQGLPDLGRAHDVHGLVAGGALEVQVQRVLEGDAA